MHEGKNVVMCIPKNDFDSFRLGVCDDGGSQEILDSLHFSLAAHQHNHQKQTAADTSIHDDLGQDS